MPVTLKGAASLAERLNGTDENTLTEVFKQLDATSLERVVNLSAIFAPHVGPLRAKEIRAKRDALDAELSKLETTAGQT